MGFCEPFIQYGLGLFVCKTMSKQRYISTRFWSDNFVSNLEPLERYLFLYLLTNEHTNISGVYEAPLKTIAFESNLDQSLILKILKKLETRVFYFEGWICMKNFTKHQSIGNPKIKTGIEEALKDVPQNILEKFISLGYPIDSLSIAHTYPSNNLIKHILNNKNSDLPKSLASPSIKENSPHKEIINYFYVEVKENKGFAPEINGYKDGKRLKECLKKYSVKQLKDLIDYYLASEKSDKLAISLSTCLSTDTINHWLQDEEAII